ncbi:hypothetical protein BaRGS_00002035 [Batillaria attramentaria]|uniref:Uncharacterized protein n=1 Tax=Batillaria attramentaria TaxID=370345 RepID=A0ABD0M4G8_9CAEN
MDNHKNDEQDPVSPSGHGLWRQSSAGHLQATFTRFYLSDVGLMFLNPQGYLPHMLRLFPLPGVPKPGDLGCSFTHFQLLPLKQVPPHPIQFWGEDGWCSCVPSRKQRTIPGHSSQPISGRVCDAR